MPSVADQVGASDIAFVGRLESAQDLDPPEAGTGGDPYDLRYELVVEHAVKGVRDGDRVVMFGDSSGTSCGTSELDQTMSRHAILSQDRYGRFVADSTPPCSANPTIDELAAFDPTLPLTSPGPVSIVVVGRLGEAELITFDAAGRPVAYADSTPYRTGSPAICPGSERMVHMELPLDGVPTLTVRDLATLDVVDRTEVDTPTADDLDWFLTYSADPSCLSPDGDDVIAVLSRENTSGGDSLVLRTSSDDADPPQLTNLGRASRAAYDSASDAVVAVSDGSLVHYDARDGTVVTSIALTRGPTEDDYDAVFVEPDGQGGWWVGLGDGDHGLATRLHVVAHVDQLDHVEHWLVLPAIENAGAAVVVDGEVLTYDTVLALPAPGSSSTDLVLTPHGREESSEGSRLADGRMVRTYWDGGTSIEVVNADGTTTPLAGLQEATYATAVVDGPSTDPA